MGLIFLIFRHAILMTLAKLWGAKKDQAVYWDSDNGIIELPTLGGNSNAIAINNNGQIVGYSYDANGTIFPVQWNMTMK
jgi:uncharacterized membrane protein